MTTETIPTTSRKVRIFRNQSFLEKAQQGIAEFMAMTKQSIGSYWESSQSTAVGTGLTFAEQNLLIPVVTDIPADDRGFRAALREFYIKMNTPIPYKDGLELEIGLEVSNSEPLSRDNMPLKIMDYIRYKHALGHPHVAKSLEAAKGNQIIKYYIFDKTASEAAETSNIKIKDEALEVYVKLKSEPKKVAQILALMGKDPRDFDGEDRRAAAFRDIADKDPALVIKTYSMDSFEERYLITMMVMTGVLNVYGTRYVIASNSETFGSNIDEAISRFKAPADRELITMLKGTTQEAMKAGKKGINLVK